MSLIPILSSEPELRTPYQQSMRTIVIKARVRLGGKLSQDWKGKGSRNLGNIKLLDKLLDENGYQAGPDLP